MPLASALQNCIEVPLLFFSFRYPALGLYYSDTLKMSFSGALAPRTPLGRHRLLAPSASVKVSPLCLGGMSFGTNWYALHIPSHLASDSSNSGKTGSAARTKRPPSKSSTTSALKGATSSIPPTATRITNPRNGSANGWPSVAAGMKWSSPRNSRPIIARLRRRLRTKASQICRYRISVAMAANP